MNEELYAQAMLADANNAKPRLIERDGKPIQDKPAQPRMPCERAILVAQMLDDDLRRLKDITGDNPRKDHHHMRLLAAHGAVEHYRPDMEKPVMYRRGPQWEAKLTEWGAL